MVIKTEPIVSEIKYNVDTSWLKIATDNVQKYAHDTNVLLSQEKVIDLNLNILKYEDKVKEAKELLKRSNLDKDVEKQIRIDLRGYTENLTEAKRRLKNYTNTWDETLSRLQSKFNDINKTINKQWWFLWKLKDWLKSAWAAFLTFFAVDRVVEFGRNLFNVTSQIESVRTAFLQLIWDQDKANKLFNEIDAFAARSPFNRLLIQKSAQRLLWFNFTAEQTIEVLKWVWDWVSAIWWNQEVFDWVVLALWQIQAKGKVSAEELLQLAERGLPVFDILRQKLGLTQKEVSNIWNAWITAAEGINAIVEGLNERFWWALEKQTQTLRGRLSNIVDLSQIRLWQLWEALSWNFSDVLWKISELLQTVSQEDVVSFWQTVSVIFWTVFQTIISSVETTFDVIQTAVRWLQDLFSFVANWFSVSQQQIENARKSWLNLFETFAIWIKTVWKTFNLLLSVVSDVATNFPDIFVIVAWNIAKIFDNLSQNIVASLVWWLDAIIAKASNISKDLWLWGLNIWPLWWPWFVSLTDWVQDLWDKFKNTWKVASTFFSEINNEINKLKSNTSSVSNIWWLWGAPFVMPELAQPSSWGRSWKSDVRKIENIEKEISKRREDFKKEREKKEEDRLKNSTDRFEKAWKKIKDVIEDQKKELETFNDEILKTKDTISDLEGALDKLNANTQQDLASRFVEVQETINDILSSWETWNEKQISDLQKELQLLTDNTTEEERKEAIRRGWLSVTESILEKRDIERQKIQEQIDAEKEKLQLQEQARDLQQQQIEKIYKTEIDLQKQATKSLWEELAKRLQLIDNYGSKVNASLLWQTSTSTQGTQANTNTVNVWDIIVNWAWDPDAVANKIFEKINRASKSAGRNNIL